MFDEFGNRMKEYENQPRLYLEPKTPVIIRIDGKAFHTFTRFFEKPFDELLMESMRQTMKYLCENVQGCVLGYTQSDEITLVLVDYKNEETSPWFGYNIQKCASIAASMATMKFNQVFRNEYLRAALHREMSGDELKRYQSYQNAIEIGAMFDARAFNIPKNEVSNCILWRQVDAARNSTMMVGLHKFSQKQIHGKSCGEVRKMLHEIGCDWELLPLHKQHGCCCVKVQEETNGVMRGRWAIDMNIPMFKGENRKYINDLIMFEEE